MKILNKFNNIRINKFNNIRINKFNNVRINKFNNVRINPTIILLILIIGFIIGFLLKKINPEISVKNYIFISEIKEGVEPGKKNNFIKNNFIILLTMTIDTGKTTYVNRKDIATRIADYRKSLQQWSRLPYKVIAIESSGYGNPFKDILKNSPNIQYFSLKIKHNPLKGKGYGEAQTIRYAISKIINNNKIFIMKITGRYSPEKNLDDVIKILLDYQPTAIIKREPHTNWDYHSEWLVSKRNFLLRLSNKCILSCNDSKGRYFEWALMKVGKSFNNLVYTDLNIKVLPTYTGTFSTYMDKI